MALKFKEIGLERWKSLLGRLDRVSFFWTPEWYSLFDWVFKVYEFEDDGGRWIVPVQVRRRFRWLKVLESAPWGGYGGTIVCEGKPHPENLAKSLLKVVSMNKSIRAVFVFHPLWQPQNIDVPQFFRISKRTTHILFLNQNPLDLCLDTCRRNYRKALRKGLVVKKIERPLGFSDYYFRLYIDTVARQRTRAAFTKAFFDKLFSIRGVNLFAVEFNGKVVAAAIVFVGRKELFYWHGASLTRFLPYRPNNLLHVEIAKWAWKTGFEIYNMGASMGVRSLERFKESFGARPVEYPIFRFGL